MKYSIMNARSAMSRLWLASAVLAVSLAIGATPASAKKRWGEIVKADAEGAAVGCGAGAVVGPEGCVVGGVIGAVAYSLGKASEDARQSADGQISVWDPTGGKCDDSLIPAPFGCDRIKWPRRGPVFSTATPVTDIGYWHNRIVRAYLAENRRFDPAILQRVAIRELGLAKAIKANPKLGEVVTTSARLSYRDPDGKRSPFGTYLTVAIDEMMDSPLSARERGVALSKIENSALERFGANETDRMAIHAYISVYRSSAAYWGTAEAIAEGNCMIEPSRCGTLPLPIKE